MAAYNDDAQFTTANIPLGVGSRHGSPGQPEVVTRFGGHVYFVSALKSQGLLPDLPGEVEKALQNVRLPHTTPYLSTDQNGRRH
jgi:hypothetical protein